MVHSIEYIIKTNSDSAHLEYRQTNYTPSESDVWVEGYNSFSDIGEADPDNLDSPLIVRVVDGGIITYYRRTLMVGEGVNNFTVSVLIDGIEGRTTFIVEEYTMFLNHRVVGSDIYVSVSANRTELERTGTITIKYTPNENIKTVLYIEQEKCEVGMLFGNCIIDRNGESSVDIINSGEFEYTFDTLTDQTDGNMEKLTLDVAAIGPHRKYFVKTIRQYVQIGPLDDTYRLMGGEWYRRKTKYVKGRFVYYYAKVSVIDGQVYDVQKYDKGLKIDAMPDKISITNYGRVFMVPNSYYVVTLANYDNVKKECVAILRYSDNASLSTNNQ